MVTSRQMGLHARPHICGRGGHHIALLVTCNLLAAPARLGLGAALLSVQVATVTGQLRQNAAPAGHSRGPGTIVGMSDDDLALQASLLHWSGPHSCVPNPVVCDTQACSGANMPQTAMPPGLRITVPFDPALLASRMALPGMAPDELRNFPSLIRSLTHRTCVSILYKLIQRRHSAQCRQYACKVTCLPMRAP